MASQTHLPAGLSREETVGLIVAAALHAVLIAWLALEPLGKPVSLPPERMTVTLADEVAPQEATPEALVQPSSAPAFEPGQTVIEPSPPGDVELIPPLPDAAPPPAPAPSPREVAEEAPKAKAKPTPKPAPKAKAKPEPKPAAKPSTKAAKKPAPKPAAKAAAKTGSKAAAKSASKPAAKAAAKPAAKKKEGGTGTKGAKASAKPAAKGAGKDAAKDERNRRRPDAPSGASRIGSDFLKGVPGEKAVGKAAAPAAATIGPQVAASLRQAVARQLKPHWVAPQGADADKLVTILRFQLNRNGSLAGRPVIVSQSGVTEANSAQKTRHAEQAIRAVQLAAPFDLPEQYYSGWKSVTSRFDRKLSQ